MKNSEKFEQAFNYFKKSYSYKMGGTQTVILPNGKSKHFDDREYYSGRGSKYNNNIKHDEIGDVKVSRKEYSAFLKMLKEREERRAINLKKAAEKAAEKAARIEEAKANGIYSLEKAEGDVGHYIELSDDESYNHHFDAERLARTLKISVEDAQLLNSNGKTYVFAKSADGNTYQLYHASLSCNHLNIHVSIASPEQISEFNHDEWASAPYAGLVGQTNKKNHFAC